MAYNPNEARDSHGRWAAGVVKGAIAKGKAGINKVRAASRQHNENKRAAISAGMAAYNVAIAATALAGVGMKIHSAVTKSPNNADKVMAFAVKYKEPATHLAAAADLMGHGVNHSKGKSTTIGKKTSFSPNISTKVSKSAGKVKKKDIL